MSNYANMNWGYNLPFVYDEHSNHLQPVTIDEPYFNQILQSLIQHPVVVETDKSTLRGTLIDVKPDHITLDIYGNYYFVRQQEITWIMPTRHMSTQQMEYDTK